MPHWKSKLIGQCGTVLYLPSSVKAGTKWRPYRGKRSGGRRVAQRNAARNVGAVKRSKAERNRNRANRRKQEREKRWGWARAFRPERLNLDVCGRLDGTPAKRTHTPTVPPCGANAPQSRYYRESWFLAPGAGRRAAWMPLVEAGTDAATGRSVLRRAQAVAATVPKTKDCLL